MVESLVPLKKTNRDKKSLLITEVVTTTTHKSLRGASEVGGEKVEHCKIALKAWSTTWKETNPNLTVVNISQVIRPWGSM